MTTELVTKLRDAATSERTYTQGDGCADLLDEAADHIAEGKLTLQQKIVILGYTGYNTMNNIRPFLEDATKRIGSTTPLRPQDLQLYADVIQKAYRDDFLVMCE